MSNPAQGAVGAEMKTAGLTLTFDPSKLFDVVAGVGDGGSALGCRIVGIMLTGGQSSFREDVGLAFYGVSAAALATPRTDSDEGTAGASAVAQALRAADWGGVSIGNKALIAAAINELEATPAPATPPAVPDSVRALSEAATQGEWYTESEKCDGSYGSGEDCGEGYLAYSILTDAERPRGNPGVIAETSNSTLGVIHEEWNEDDFTAWDETARANTALIVYAVNRLREEIATHPGGQSDDGTERCIACSEPLKTGERVLSDANGGTIHAACCGPERESYTGADGEPLGPNDPIPQGYVYKPEHPAEQSAGSGAEAMRAKAAEVARNNAAVSGDGELYIAHKIADEIKALPLSAPDSTRTGQAEALRSAMIRALDGHTAHSRDCHMSGDYLCQQVWPLVEAALAARPAAPEAQGAWRSIETAPKDGTRVDIWIGGTRVADVWWGRPYHSCGEAGRYCDCCPSYDGWCDDFGYLTGEEGRHDSEGPTHWMPLPAPPSSGQGGR